MDNAFPDIHQMHEDATRPMLASHFSHVPRFPQPFAPWGGRLDANSLVVRSRDAHKFGDVTSTRMGGSADDERGVGDLRGVRVGGVRSLRGVTYIMLTPLKSPTTYLYVWEQYTCIIIANQ